jgi:hypothetical protein
MSELRKWLEEYAGGSKHADVHFPTLAQWLAAHGVVTRETLLSEQFVNAVE